MDMDNLSEKEVDDGYILLVSQEQPVKNNEDDTISMKSYGTTIHDGDVLSRLHKFIQCFVEGFEAKLNAYRLILEGIETKSGTLSNTFTQVLQQGGEVIGGYCFGGLLGFSAIGGNLGAEVGKEIGMAVNKMHNKSKVMRSTNLIHCHQQDKEKFRNELIKIAFDVFRCFEVQFAKVTTSRGANGAMRKLALDAINRAINYLEGKDEELTSKCVIMGKSKKRKVYNLHVGFIIKKDKESMEDWNTADLYEKTGVITTVPFGYHAKENGGTDVNKFGYRLLLDSENWDDIKEQYQPILQQSTKSDEYGLKSEDLENMSSEILKYIETNDGNMEDSKIKDILKEVKEDILSSVSQLMQGNPNIPKPDYDILENIQNHLNSLSDEVLKQQFRQATEDRLKIIKSLESNHDDNLKQHKINQALLLNIQGAIQNRKDVFQTEGFVFNVREPVKQFNGRQDELKQLHEQLGSHTSPTVITSISGLGGIGKTEFVRKYCFEYGEFYSNNVIWIDSETEQSIRESLRDLIAAGLKIDVEDERDIKGVVKNAYTFFSKSKCLFIFDNVEKDTLQHLLVPLQELPPTYKKPYIVLTSRNQEWETGVQVIRLDVLKHEDAVNVVREGLGMADDFKCEEIVALVDKLGCFPLAIRQAVAYIKDQNVSDDFTIKNYLDAYESEADNLLNFEGASGMSYDYMKTTFTTWKITMAKIQQEANGPLALDILNIIAYLSPDRIKRDMFLVLNNDEVKIKAAVRLLVKYSMVNAEKKQSLLNIHRLVQEVIRLELKSQKREKLVVKSVLNLINSSYKNELLKSNKWSNVVVSNGYFDTVKRFMSKGLQFTGGEGLIGACYGGHFAVVKYLKNKGVDVNTVYNNETPLFVACLQGHIEIVKFLVKNGATIDAGSDFKTPLYAACQQGHYEIATYLIDNGAKIDVGYIWDSPLHVAYEKGHFDMVKLLLEKGDNTIDSDYVKSFLYLACQNGVIAIVKFLIEKGVNTESGESLLYVACQRGDFEMVKLLVETNAKIDVGCDGKTPLYAACLKSHFEIVKYLVERGAKLETSNNSGNALHAACIANHAEIANYLIEKGANINTSHNGITPLYEACLKGNFEMVVFLTEKGAEINITNNLEAPLYAACLGGNQEIVKFLVEKGAEINTDNNGKTALYAACSAGHFKIVAFLLEKGAKINTSYNGQTPLYEAYQKGHFEIVALLKQKMLLKPS